MSSAFEIKRWKNTESTQIEYAFHYLYFFFLSSFLVTIIYRKLVWIIGPLWKVINYLALELFTLNDFDVKNSTLVYIEWFTDTTFLKQFFMEFMSNCQFNRTTMMFKIPVILSRFLILKFFLLQNTTYATWKFKKVL